MTRFTFKIHGTYPMDSGRWRMVRSLTLQEVADMLHLDLREADYKEEENQNFYLWFNKGYVVLRHDLQAVNPDLGTVMMEMMMDSPEVKGIKTGDQAIYLHDGRYHLIERCR